MRTVYTLNLDYRCNERCVFCAADLGGIVPLETRRPSLTLDRIRAELDGARPGPQDRVLLSGGEPTLHHELLPIAHWLSRDCPNLVLFTNGLRLAEPGYAAATAEAGIRRFEVSVYGADAAAHDAVTRRRGSFDRTIRALRELVALQPRFGTWVSVRLLVSRHTLACNEDVVRHIAAEVGPVDSFSLQQLVLSGDALDSAAPVSWADAREPVNSCARLVRSLGYPLEARGVPLCVFDDDVAAWVEEGAADDTQQYGPWTHRYLDPLVAPTSGGPVRRPALPDVCLPCPRVNDCPRVDRGYLRLFGEAGLSSAAAPTRARATADSRP